MDIVLRFLTHYGMHFLVPGIIAYLFFKDNWLKVWFILIATMLIDLDHLLANPVFDTDRCSINFHSLHTYWAAMLYVTLLFYRKTLIVAIGLLFHLLTDALDCLWC